MSEPWPKPPLGADFSFLPPRGILVVGFSGGADSTALAHCLAGRVRPERLLLAHINHGLRGQEAERDEAFAREFARQQGLRFALLRADVAKLAKERRQGLEECGRQVRYGFWERLLAEAGGEGAILTAHNADDNAETMLLNFARGTSLSGICGIPARRGKVLRPFLGVSRAAIEDYCRENGLHYVTDSTNLTEEFRRNQARHKLLPVLKEWNPRFLEAASRTSETLRETQAFLEQEAQKLLERAKASGGLWVSPLKEAHPALRREALRLWLLEQGSPQVQYLHLQELMALLETGGRRSLPGGGLAECAQGMLSLGKQEKPKGFRLPAALGKTPLPNGKVLLLEEKTREALEKEQNFHNLLFKNSFDYDTIKGTFLVRTREPGDRFLPVGRQGSRSLKQLFQEQKIPASKRGEMVLLVCGKEEELVFCEGFGVSRKFRVTEKTTRAVTAQVTGPLEKMERDGCEDEAVFGNAPRY